MSSRLRCDRCHELLDDDATCPVCGDEVPDPGGTVVMRRPDLGGAGPIPADPSASDLVSMPLPEDLRLVVDVVDGPDRGSSFAIRTTGAIIGRDECDVALSDPGVSRRHAALEVYGPAYLVVKDLNSTNGTFVNGRLVAYSRVSDGDEVLVGDTRLVVSVDAVDRTGRGA